MADQVDFPNIYIDGTTGGVGSEADPYTNLSDVNWTTGGDNSIFDYLAGSPAASPTIHLDKAATWREQMTVGASGTATYPIVITSYGSGADPIINGGDVLTTFVDSTALHQESYSLTHDAESSAAIAFRIPIAANDLSVNGAYIRVTIGAHSAQSTFTSAYIGEKASAGDAYDMEGGTITEILFDAGSGCTVAAGVDKTSDWLSYTFDKTKDYIISFAADNGYARKSNSGNGASYKVGDGANAGTADVTGYTTVATSYILKRLDIGIAAPANVYEKTGVTTQPFIAIYDGTLLTVDASSPIDVGSNEWYWVNDTLYVNVGEDPDTGVLEAGQRNACITASSKDYITVDSLKVTCSNYEAIYNNGGTTWIIQDCTADKTSVTRDAGSHYGTIRMKDSSVATIDGCTITNTVTDGIYCDAFDDLTITDNTLTNNLGLYGDNIHLADCDTYSVLRNTCDTSTVGNIKAILGAGGTIANNTCANGVTTGIAVAGTTIAVYRNLITDCNNGATSAGIQIADNGIDIAGSIYYNIIDSCSYGIYCVGNTHNRNINFYNNVVYADTKGRGLSLISTNYWGNIKNNIFRMPSATSYVFQVSSIKGGETVTSDYNSIGPDATNSIYYGGTTYSTLATYVAGKSQDASSQNSDPLMTDPANDDFTLQFGSPCINRGVDVVLSTDYLEIAKVPTGHRPDIGAYEHKDGSNAIFF